MESLGPRPRDLTVRSEREVDRRVRISTFGLFLVFLFGSLGVFAVLAEAGAQALSGVAYILVLGAYGASFGFLLWRSSRRELALTRLTSLFIEGLPVGVIFVDAEGKIAYANPALGQTVLGRASAELIGRRGLDLIHPADRARVGEELQRRRSGAVSTYEARVLRDDGRVASVVITATPFQDDGRFDGAMAVIADISEIVEVRERAARYRDLASFALDAVTHDLSNRMQTVIGQTGIAAMSLGKDEARTRIAVAGVTLAAEQASHLIREVKQIAIAERENWPKRRMSVRELLEGTLSMADVLPPLRVELKISPEAEGAMVEASELGFLGLAKIVEYAAEGALPERRGAGLEVGAASDGGQGSEVTIRVKGFRKEVSDDDVRQMLALPGQEATRELRWRSGVKLALSSAIAQAKGWKVQALREGEGVVFEVRVPRSGPG